MTAKHSYGNNVNLMSLRFVATIVCLFATTNLSHMIIYFLVSTDHLLITIRDITSKVRPIEDPILAYSAAAEINQLQWCGLHEDWVAVCYDKYLQILRV